MVLEMKARGKLKILFCFGPSSKLRRLQGCVRRRVDLHRSLQVYHLRHLANITGI